MNNAQQFNDTPEPRSEYQRLAHWLQQLMQEPQAAQTAPPSSETIKSSLLSEHDTQLELLLDENYHLRFYQQLPDFILALLNNDPEAATSYAPLLYHMVGCNVCHRGYLELYDALRAAIYPREPRPVLGQGTRTLEATPPRMLAHLCQSLITQAEAVLRQARHDGTDGNDAARALLQLAIRISAHIVQSTVRRQALHDLVRVATLSEGPSDRLSESGAAVYEYTPVLVGAGGKGAMRGMNMLTRPHEVPQERLAIVLQSHSLEGTVTQRDRMLELHLQNLDAALRNHLVTISVPLGSLIEPIRWIGGNPRAIRSTTPVDASGAVTVALGETDLQLSNPEERNLLEATFLLLEVRTAD